MNNGNEAKFLASLQRGNTWSRTQVKHTFKLANPSAAILRFREKGIKIESNLYLDKKTHTIRVKYSLAK